MRLGIGSYTFAWAVGVPDHPPSHPLTPLALVQRAEELGIRVVQFCDNLPLLSLRPSELEEVETFLEVHGISVEIGTRGLSDVSNLLAHLELARRFAAPFVRLVVDSKGFEPSPEECVARLRPLVPQFVDAGVKLALENHDRFSSSTLSSIIEELGPENVGICLDTVNSFGALEGPEVVVKTLAPYALNLHVKDFTIRRVSSQMGYVIDGCAAGQGRLNVPWLCDQLRALGRDVNAVLELWTPYCRTLEDTIALESQWAADSLRYLRRFIPD